MKRRDVGKTALFPARQLIHAVPTDNLLRQMERTSIYSDSIDDSDELITYQEAAELLEAPYWKVTEATHSGALRPVRRRRDRTKYLRRIDVESYAELQARSKPQLMQELIELRRERVRSQYPPVPPTSPGKPHARADTGDPRTRTAAEIAPASVMPLRHAILDWLDKLEAEQQRSMRKKKMRRTTGEEVSRREQVLSFLGEFFGVAFFAMARWRIQTDEGLVETWQNMIRVGDTNPAIRADVEEIQRSLNPPQASTSETVDPRQIALFDQGRSTAQEAAVAPPGNGPPSGRRRRSRLEGAA